MGSVIIGGAAVMALDLKICSRARLARDARFDGKFFIAVLSTRVYCRPICRSRTSQERNVRYFPSAAAAAEAGFRPCLRCRPECSPGTPAWLGTQNTVSRAMRLIAQNGLEDGGIEPLAERLGVGSRHLRRLFLQHLGATPSAVAQTRRLHFAKKLIDETTLPMTQVALASGFGCVRRFNAAIRKTYSRTPTQIRALVRQTSLETGNQYVFRLHFRQPYNWQGVLAFLSARATPGVEAIENGVFRRSFSLHEHIGFFEVSLDQGSDALALRVQFDDPQSLFTIVERVRAMFDLDADWTTIVRTLKADSLLVKLVESAPGLRVPGCWNTFELATHAILAQKTRLKRATKIAGEMVKMFGQPFSGAHGLTHLFPSPEILADANLFGLGLSRSRAQSIRALARAVCEGEVSFDRSDPDDLIARIMEIPGVGKSTARYIAMRALGQPDAFPSGDINLRRAAGMERADELERRSELWRPWRAYAAMYLWNIAGRCEMNSG
jgi:AraC family transcriptional regulator of adaptative response / DNA-3-methyladenine glycosylase II